MRAQSTAPARRVPALRTPYSEAVLRSYSPARGQPVFTLLPKLRLLVGRERIPGFIEHSKHLLYLYFRLGGKTEINLRFVVAHASPLVSVLLQV